MFADNRDFDRVPVLCDKCKAKCGRKYPKMYGLESYHDVRLGEKGTVHHYQLCTKCFNMLVSKVQTFVERP